MKSKAKLSMIVAVARNGVIGKDGDMPWRLASDMAHFKRVTSTKPVLMGRKTWESLFVRPLPGRDNLVLSRNAKYDAPGALVFSDMSKMIEHAKSLNSDEAIIIGGEALYRAALPFCDRIYLSRVDAAPQGDTFFPELDEKTWALMQENSYPASDRDDHAFVTQVFERR